MRLVSMLVLATLCGCSTLQSRLADPPVFSRSTGVTVSEFQACFVPATSSENVGYLPRGKGGTFTSAAGPQNYIMWAVTIDDLGIERRVVIHSAGPSGAIRAKVEACS